MLSRRTPLKRTPMRRGPGSTSYSRRPRDLEYVAAVRALPCLLSVVGPFRGMIVVDLILVGPCRGPVEADHLGERGLGQKADDRTCVPMCTRHHGDRHAGCGWFRKLSKEELRRWRQFAIARTTLAIAERRAARACA
jgi:hypothetical protein